MSVHRSVLNVKHGRDGRRLSSGATALLSLMKNEHGPDGIPGIDFSCPNIVQPVFMQFFESANVVIRETTTDLTSCRNMVMSLQESLTMGSNFAELAGMLYTTTFGMRSKQLDKIFGPDIAPRIRKPLIKVLSQTIDALWERFGLLLVERYRSFEAAFKDLDSDESGFVDREEFVHAYVDIHMEALANMKDEQPPSTSSMTTSGSKLLKPGAVDLEGLARRKNKVGPIATARNNEMILKTEAGIIFDMLFFSDDSRKHKGEADTPDVQPPSVSMQLLVLRLAGLNHQAMASLRGVITNHHSTLQSLFAKFGRPHELELTREEFERMYNTLYRYQDDEEMHRQTVQQQYTGQHAHGVAGLGHLPGPGPVEQSAGMNSHNRLEPSVETSAMAARIFNGIDTDGSGLITIMELQNTLAAFGKSTSFSVFRRRLLLHYGSFEYFFQQLSQSGGWSSPEQVSSFAFMLDITSADWLDFLRKLGLTEDQDQEVLAPLVPCDGYSVEEFAISAFLNKPEDSTIEELLLKNKKVDRDRDISYQEFAERWVAGVQRDDETAPPTPTTASSLGKKASPRKTQAATQVVAPRAVDKKATLDVRRVGSPSPTAGLMVTCRLAELKQFYSALEREHRRVTANVLMRSMANVSDVLALDRTAYQAGDIIVVRVRLSAEGQRRCKERPFIAVVPERMEWKGHGRAGSWTLNGERATDIATFGGASVEVPHGPHAGVPREQCLRIMAPLVLTSEPRHEIRLFASSNGKEPAKQVGRSVSFDLLMPAPQKPSVDHVELSADTGDASVVLHWSTPPGNFDSMPIVNFVVQVEPLIYSHALVVDQGDMSAQDEEGGSMESGHKFKEVEVWSPALKGFTKELSYGIDGLKRGVQYRFGVQCIHARIARPDDEERTEVRGAPSELSDVAMMPFYHVTDPPEVLIVEQTADLNTLNLVWKAPQDEGSNDANRVCTYLVQYRHCRAAVRSRQPSTSTDKTSEGKAAGVGQPKGEEEAEEEVEEEEDSIAHFGSEGHDGSEVFGGEESSLPLTDPGWVDIDETKIFISQPRWVDFVGWEVACHIVGLSPIDGDLDEQEHEFRISAVNLAGNSPWSKPSEPMTFARVAPLEQATLPSPVTNLEVLEVRGHHATGDKTKGEVRSQCRLRWLPPVTANDRDLPRYSIFMRDATHVRSEGGWNSAATFHLCDERVAWSGGRVPSSDRYGQPVEVLVTGLEAYPPFATLALQVRAITFHWTSTAEVIIPGVEMPRPSPPPGPPEVVQVLAPSTAGAPPTSERATQGDEVLELRWPAVHSSSGPPHYVLQAASTAKPSLKEQEDAATVGEGAAAGAKELEWKSLKWSDFAAVKDACISMQPPRHGRATEVRCYVPRLNKELLWRFRVCVAGADGYLGAPSEASVVPFQFPSTQSDEEPMPVIVPDRPQGLKVLQVDRLYCELAWEQRMPTLRTPPTRCEVQLCRSDLGEDTWEPVRCTYLSSEEGSTDDQWTVRAAAFFRQNLPSQGASGPHWRVRARTGGSEWSQPTLWQLPHQPVVPPTCSIPKIVNEDLQHITLEWTYETKEAQSSLQCTVQVQGVLRGSRMSSRPTDWAPVQVFTTPIASSGLLRKRGVHLVRAVIDRGAVAESVGSLNSSCFVRFRVILSSSDGAEGPASEASEEVSVQAALPSVQAPASLELTGRGRLLLEAPRGHLEDFEFVRLKWQAQPQAQPELDTQSQLRPLQDDGAPDSESTSHSAAAATATASASASASASAAEEGVGYSVELTEGEHEEWAPLQSTLLALSPTLGLGSAMAVLPPAREGARRGRLRVMAKRRHSLLGTGLLAEEPPVSSSPSSQICWGLPVELCGRPCLLQAARSHLSLCFVLSGLTARPGMCAVSALVEVIRRSSGSDLLETGGSFSQRSLLSKQDSVVVESEGSWCHDDQETSLDQKAHTDGSISGGFTCVGEFPVNWRGMRKQGLEMETRPGDASEDGASGLACMGVVILDAEHMLAVGEPVRVTLRVQSLDSSGDQAGRQPGPSDSILVEYHGPNVTPVISLQYPSWTGFVSPEGRMCFEPQVHVGLTAVHKAEKASQCKAELQLLHEAVDLDAEAPPCLRFELLSTLGDGGSEGGCSVDPNTGVLTVDSAEMEGLLHVTVQVSVLAHWLSDEGVPLTPGVVATAKLSASALDPTVHRALCEMLEGTPLKKLAEEGSTIGSVLRNPRLLPLYSLLHSTCESSIGKPAVELVEAMLRLPPDVIASAAELPEEDLAARLWPLEEESSEEEDDDEEGSLGSETSSSQASSDASEYVQLEGSEQNDFFSMGPGSIQIHLAEAQAANGKPRSSRLSPGLTPPPDDGDKLQKPKSPPILQQPRASRIHSLTVDQSAGSQSSGLRRTSTTDGHGLEHTTSKRHSKLVPAGETVSGRASLRPRTSLQQGTGNAGNGARRASRRSSAATANGGRRVSSAAHAGRRISKQNSSGTANAFRRTSSQGHSSVILEEGELGRDSPTRRQRPSSEGGSTTILEEASAEKTRESKEPESGLATPGQMRHNRPGANPVALDISYPDLTPLWPAFVDVEFQPLIKASRVRRGSLTRRDSLRRSSLSMPPPPLGSLSFAVQPELPAAVVIDPSTGVIRGSPLTEHATGGQYTVTVRWEESGDVAARVAIAFAVVPADIAAVCNSVYLEQQPPAFRTPPRLEPKPDTGEADPDAAEGREPRAESRWEPRTRHQPYGRPQDLAEVRLSWQERERQEGESQPAEPRESADQSPSLSLVRPPSRSRSAAPARQASTAPSLSLATGTEPLFLGSERATTGHSPYRHSACRSGSFRKPSWAMGSLPHPGAAAEPTGERLSSSSSRKTVFRLGPPLQGRGGSEGPRRSGAGPPVLPLPATMARTPRTRPVY